MDPLLGWLPCCDCCAWSEELELLELLELLLGLDPDELEESGLVLEVLLSKLVEDDELELFGLELSIVPLALLVPEIVESCDAVPAAVPPCGYCDDVSLEALELLEEDEPRVVEFKLPLAEPLGAPAPEVLIDVLL